MYQVGDETEGFCPRCRLNTYQVIAATDGETIQSVACRTCRNTFAHRREVTEQEVRQNNLKKLAKMQKSRMPSPAPEVLTRGRRKVSDFDRQLQALAQLNGRDPVEQVQELSADARARSAVSQAASGTAATVEPATSGAALENQAPGERWKALTAPLGWRDGKPYSAQKTYKEGDVVLHKALGMGIVEQVVHDHACLVLFRDSQTVLEMATPLS